MLLIRGADGGVAFASARGAWQYQGLDLEQLDPDDEGERAFLLKAQHL